MTSMCLAPDADRSSAMAHSHACVQDLQAAKGMTCPKSAPPIIADQQFGVPRGMSTKRLIRPGEGPRSDAGGPVAAQVVVGISRTSMSNWTILPILFRMPT